MNRKMRKYFLRTLLISALFVLVLGGVEVSAARKTGFVKENGKSYYIKADGTKQKGWLELKGRKYYFDKKTGVQLKGWAKDSNGKVVRYFSRGTGAMATGFLTDGRNITRYFEPKTGLLVRGFKEIKGHTYYFTSGTGAMLKGWAQNSKGQKRYFSSSGRMAKGWLKNSKGQYRYFSLKNGIMYTGVKKIENAHYYFNEKTGLRYQGGFLDVEDKTYYFDKETGKAQKKWLELDGKKYYFSKNGVMARDTQIKVDGVVYKIDKNGVAVPEKNPATSNFVTIFDKKRNENYTMWKTYMDMPGLASGEVSDVDILAALCASEAGDQGHIGMVAVGMCVLNRTLDRGFPSEVRYVVFEGGPGNYPQYTVVANNQLLRRLRDNNWDSEGEKQASYKAAKEALRIFNDYVKTKKPRKLKGFKADFDYKYFMMESSYWKQPLDFAKVDNFLYKDHMFFVDWVSP